MLSWNVLIFKTCSSVVSFLTFMLAPSLIILLLLFLARLLLPTVCLPSKQPLFPPYLVSLLKFPAPTAPLPLQHILTSLLTSHSLFSNPSFSSHPTSHSFGITSHFLFISFYRRCFWPQSQNLWHGTIPMPLWVSTGHISRGVSSAWSLHTKLGWFCQSGVPHCPAFQTTCAYGNRTSGSCSLWQQARVFISFFKKSLF